MVLSNMFQYGDLTPKENMELLKKMLHRVHTHTPDESVVKKEFLDALDFAPVGVIDLIKSLSVTVPLYDMQKRAALKQKTGFDVDAAIKHDMEDKEDEQETILKQGTERRVKKEEEIPPAGRRTTGSKYNVVTPKSN